MPYPGNFNKDELLKIENETAHIDKVRLVFIKLWVVMLEELRRLKPTTSPLLQNTAQGYARTCRRMT